MFPDLGVTEPGFETLKKAEMNTKVGKFLNLTLLAGAIAAITVSGIAIGSLAISAKGANAMRAPGEPLAAVHASAQPGAGAHKCGDCGVIESAREIEAPEDKSGVSAPGRLAVCTRVGNGAKHVWGHEITIRLRDGSMRVITDAKPARWRRGERVTIIAGLN
jgi:hypothetical protein